MLAHYLYIYAPYSEGDSSRRPRCVCGNVRCLDIFRGRLHYFGLLNSASARAHAAGNEMLACIIIYLCMYAVYILENIIAHFDGLVNFEIFLIRLFTRI